jgi:hypothetical protein
MRTIASSRVGAPLVDLRVVVALSDEAIHAVASDDPVDHPAMRGGVDEHVADLVARTAVGDDEVPGGVRGLHAGAGDRHVEGGSSERGRPDHEPADDGQHGRPIWLQGIGSTIWATAIDSISEAEVVTRVVGAW